MYKGASQGNQTHLSRKAVFDAGANAARADAVPHSKNEARRIFRRAMGELDRQIAMLSPKSAKRKELGILKQKLQRQRELEKGNGIGAGKPNMYTVSQLFKKKVFAILPDDAQRLWDEAMATEAREREHALQQATSGDDHG
jgi:hypothetical protein